MTDQKIIAIRAVLRWYVRQFPAFRAKPEGSPGSFARTQQEIHQKMEDAALAVIRSIGSGEQI